MSHGTKTIPARRPPVIDFQNEIVEMYVTREGVEDGVEGAVLFDGLFVKAWGQTRPHK